MYSRILVPVDGSETSKLGLLEVIKIAKDHNSQLRLVHVVNEFVMDYSIGTTLYSSQLIDAIRNVGKEILAGMEALVSQHGITPQSVLLESIGIPAANLIVTQAKEWPADLIVMGTHGRRGLRRMAMGSDAELVLRSTPVPVLLVRHTDQHDK